MHVDSIYVLQLYHALPPAQRSEMLKRLCEMVIEWSIPHSKRRSEIIAASDLEAGVYDEMAKRLASVRSSTFASEVFAYNNENFCIEEAIFPDGRAEAIVVSDPEVTLSGEAIYDLHQEASRYIDGTAWIDPSDYSGPREDDAENEHERQVEDFSGLVRDWRHSFISGLVTDANYSAARFEAERRAGIRGQISVSQGKRTTE